MAISNGCKSNTDQPPQALGVTVAPRLATPTVFKRREVVMQERPVERGLKER
jgi:hypothetical protein